jgi:hypothetical protein
MHGRTRRAVLGLIVVALTTMAAAVPAGADVANADRCEFLVPGECLLPFPSDHFTVADPATDTGRRLNFNVASMPVAAPVTLAPGFTTPGGPFDPTDINRNDGFSPGSQIVVRVPGLDNEEALRRTGATPITDIARYADREAPVVVINARTGERQPIWVEVDAHASSDATRALLIYPARNFDEGERYIVALRSLRDAAGKPIQAREPFRSYRDQIATGDPAVEARRAHMEDIFATLRRERIPRGTLYLAWDFTVASERSIAGRMLRMRDDAFAKLGDTNLADLTVQGDAPQFTASVQNFTADQNPDIARRVTGTVTVPCYVAPNCLPPAPGTAGKRMNDPDGDGLPDANGTYNAAYRCDIPRVSGVDGAAVRQLRPSLYGHGLLGSTNEMNQEQLRRLMQDHGFMFCGTKWIGIADEDQPFVGQVVTNWSFFPGMAARMNQGMLDFLYLGRLMIHPQGFAASPAFQNADGDSVIDTRRLFYDGNSQGGIMGGALTAVAVDNDRAALGVPGMNYSTLLPRSVDFNTLRTLNNLAYGDELERPVIYGLVQLMWDRAEADGYAHHMTSDPLPNTPAHEVLMHVALGDHQVAPISADVEARTIGAFTNRPGIDPGRSFEVDPLWGIPTIPSFATTPFAGSAIIYWDSGPFTAANPGGTPVPPTQNLPPTIGQDPHEFPRRSPAARQQKSDFLRIDGRVTDQCGGGPCYSNGWLGVG